MSYCKQNAVNFHKNLDNKSDKILKNPRWSNLQENILSFSKIDQKPAIW
jgi:hypothetical protein